MGQDTLDFGTSFSSVSRRKVCQAGVSFPFEPTEGGQSSVRYAHFVLASFQKILNSFNPVLPRILIFLRGVRCLFRFPVLFNKTVAFSEDRQDNKSFFVHADSGGPS